MSADVLLILTLITSYKSLKYVYRRGAKILSGPHLLFVEARRWPSHAIVGLRVRGHLRLLRWLRHVRAGHGAGGLARQLVGRRARLTSNTVKTQDSNLRYLIKT